MVSEQFFSLGNLRQSATTLFAFAISISFARTLNYDSGAWNLESGIWNLESISSPRRPPHPSSGEQVEVQMKDDLSGFAPGVGHEAKIRHAELSRESRGACDDLPQKGRIRSSVVQVLQVFLRDQEDVRGRLRIDVLKSQDPIVFVDLLGRDLARHDLAKDALAHRRA